MSVHLPISQTYPSAVLLAVLALVRLLRVRRQRHRREAQAALVTTRIRDASVHPDTPPTGLSAALARASDEAGVLEAQVAVLVDLEALELGVAGRGLLAGDVAEAALAHAGAVDVQLLDVLLLAVAVEEELAVPDVEEGPAVVVVAGRAGGLGAVLAVDEDAALGGVDLAEVDGASRAEGHDGEDLRGGDRGSGRSWVGDRSRLGSRGRGGRSHGGEEGAEDGELHGCGWFVAVVVSSGKRG